MVLKHFDTYEANADLLDLKAHGRRVIGLEAEALALLAESLDDGFEQAVQLILENTSRLIVTGMGKSGHIGRKVAATLSATGAPAIFVHPAEAAHGDLGMVIPGDLLLVFSNSGNTAEVRSIAKYARSIGCKVIGVASSPDSWLIRNCDVRIMLPAVREACPVNIAPTTSTTLMLALGDALAITAMNIRGVSRERLQILHPGGLIGGKLSPLSDVMHSGNSMPLVLADMPMREVVLEMTNKRFGIAGVVDSAGRLVGVITDGDLRRHIDNLMSCVASDVMTGDPITVEQTVLAEDARKLMDEGQVTALFVVCGGMPVGIIHIHDLGHVEFS